jgi:hypothetical protein
MYLIKVEFLLYKLTAPQREFELVSIGGLNCADFIVEYIKNIVDNN